MHRKKGKSQDVKVDKRMAIDYVATYILLLLMDEILMKSQGQPRGMYKHPVKNVRFTVPYQLV